MRGKLPMSIFGTSLFLGRRTESLHPRSLHQYISLCSGDLTRLWKITILNEKTHSKWPCSIAMLNYQKVYQSIHIYIYMVYLLLISHFYRRLHRSHPRLLVAHETGFMFLKDDGQMLWQQHLGSLGLLHFFEAD